MNTCRNNQKKIFTSTYEQHQKLTKKQAVEKQ